MEETNYKNLYDNLMLDYQNLKSRVESEKESVRNSVRTEMIKDMFDVYKDLKYGMKSGDTGCTLILGKLVKTLSDKDIAVLDEQFLSEFDYKFNDKYAEAVSVEHTSDRSKVGHIANIISDGIADLRSNKIIVYPKVTVFN